MNKKEKKVLEDETKKFQRELRELGVKDKTIEFVMKDIQEFQIEQSMKMIKEMQQRMFEILKEEE